MLRVTKLSRAFIGSQRSLNAPRVRDFHSSMPIHKDSSKYSSRITDIFDNKRKTTKVTQPEQNNEGAAVSTMKIITEKPAKFLAKYIDPTSRLNLTKPSELLLKEIQTSFAERSKQRFKDSSVKWKQNVIPDIESREVAEKLNQYLSNAKVNGSSIVEPPSVGDIVTLLDNLRLYIIVSGPKSIKSATYTFMDARGEIVFGKNVMIKCRVPGVIPKEFHEYLQKCICLEEKVKGIAPIGMTDDFNVKNDENKEKTNQSLEPEFVDQTDFIVAQASSQLLKDTEINTYIVPLLARTTYAEPLAKLGIDTFKKIGEVNRKLEKLHKTLQYDHEGNLNAPRTLSIFELLYHLENPEFEFKKSGNSRLGLSLDINQSFEDFDYNASTYLAALFVLKKQSRLWNLQLTRANECQTKVTILPVSDLTYIDKVVNYLKNEDGVNEVSKYCADILSGNQPTSQPKLYNEIIAMLKDFVNRKFEDDPVVETVLVYLLRGIEKYFSNVDDVFSSNFVNEYSRTRAYELLMNLENADSIVNPAKWSKSSSWPYEKTSYLDDLSQSYYDCTTYNVSAPIKSTDVDLDQLDQQPLLNLNEPVNNTQAVGYVDDFFDSDPMKNLRTDLRDVAVYCIDSDFAYEIDDGISIHEDGDKYVISVHIAEPSSYVKPDSILSSIAFNRTTTKYFPDTALLMFPPIISELGGLGIDTKDTRSFSIQYKLNKESLDDFFKQQLIDPESDIDTTFSKNIMSQIEATKEIKYNTLRNFRKGFTYQKVTEVLASANRIELFKSDPDYNNLFKLFQISNILKKIRSKDIPVESKFTTEHLRVSQNDEVASQSCYIEHSSGDEMRLRNSNQSIFLPEKVDIKSATSLVTECMVFANYLTGRIAHEKDIKILYRTFNFLLPDALKKQFEQLTKEGPLLKEEFDFHSFVKPARYSASHGKHALIGLGSYTTITSPMRRFVDMINQWKFQDYFLGRKESYIKDENLENIVNVVNSKNFDVKREETWAGEFWTGIFLREYHKLFQEGKIKNPIIFSLVLNEAPRKDAVVSVTYENFRTIRAHLEVSQSFMEDYEKGIIGKSGIVNSNRLQISRVDYIENDLLFKYV